MWELQPEQATGAPLKRFDGAVDTKLRIYLKEQMHMVGHDFQPKDVALEFRTDALDEVFQAARNLLDKYRSTVLRAPHNMVLARVDHVVIGLVPDGILTHKAIIQIGDI